MWEYDPDEREVAWAHERRHHWEEQRRPEQKAFNQGANGFLIGLVLGILPLVSAQVSRYLAPLALVNPRVEGATVEASRG